MTETEFTQHENEVIASGPFAASWDALKGYRVPEWYTDAKFGIFIHWGIYSVPAFNNEWYSRNMYQEDMPEFKHHVETYGSHEQFGYKDFIPQFTAKNFDAQAWISLFKQAGARYVVPVAEHHDGFAMYRSSFSPWNAIEMGPRRDVLGELAAAAREQGLTLGCSFHRAEHWWFFEGGLKFPSDARDPRNAAFYGPPHFKEEIPDEAFLEDWLARACELLDVYQPQVFYFDWWIEEPVFQPYLQRFAAYYYNRAAQWQKGVVINYKHVDRPDNSFAPGSAVFDIERGQAAGILPEFWQSDTAILRNSWCYISNPDYKDVPTILADLVDVVSKNGTLLLNLGPRSDGTIPAEDQAILQRIGRWLTVNGEAIYGSRPWRIYGEGPTEVSGGNFSDGKPRTYSGQDIRFTTQGDTLYATLLAWPEDNSVLIASLAEGSAHRSEPITKVELLGSVAPLIWKREPEGLRVWLLGETAVEGIAVLRIR